MTTKKNVDRDSLSEEIKESIAASTAANPGIAGTSNIEPIIDFEMAQRDKVYSNDDSYIVLGGDRVSSLASGYGGSGDTGAHMIDLVVGRDPTVSGNPSFKGDAARIYISQRADLDNYFGLVAGNVGMSKKRSAVGIKADGIRIVGREGVKIVTMGKGTMNSLGDKIQTYTGIDLIAGNDDQTSEPIAKADKVTEVLNAVMDSLEDISAVVENFMDAQSSFNTAITNHIHIAPPVGPTSPSPECVAGGIVNTVRTQVLAKVPLKFHRMKCMSVRLNHLQPFTEGYIGSRYNTTN